MDKFIEPTERHINFRKHLEWFVTGAVFKWREENGMDTGDIGAWHHMRQVHGTVERYLKNTATLDSACSDLDCTIALEAAAVFGRTNERKFRSAP